jgi:hypothetical protein
MKAIILCALLLVSSSLVRAQSVVVTHTSKELGFSFTAPADWEVMDMSAAAKEQARQSATTEEDKKGLGCVEVGFTARHGNPPSVMTEAALPFDCYGQKMTEEELPGFASVASAGLAQNFDLSEPVTSTYQLGSHHIFGERVKATVKGQPFIEYTVEIACGVTQKAAVCWMTMANDAAALTAFEHAQVALDGEKPSALVPPDAFVKKP